MSQTSRIGLNSLDLPRLLAFAKQFGLDGIPAPGATVEDFRHDLLNELFVEGNNSSDIFEAVEALKNRPDSDFDEERKLLTEAEEEFENDPTFAADEDQWESETFPPKGRPLRPQDLGFLPGTSPAEYHRKELKRILAKVTCTTGEGLTKLQIQANIHAALLASYP